MFILRLHQDKCLLLKDALLEVEVVCLEDGQGGLEAFLVGLELDEVGVGDNGRVVGVGGEVEQGEEEVGGDDVCVFDEELGVAADVGTGAGVVDGVVDELFLEGGLVEALAVLEGVLVDGEVLEEEELVEGVVVADSGAEEEECLDVAGPEGAADARVEVEVPELLDSLEEGERGRALVTLQGESLRDAVGGGLAEVLEVVGLEDEVQAVASHEGDEVVLQELELLEGVLVWQEHLVDLLVLVGVEQQARAVEAVQVLLRSEVDRVGQLDGPHQRVRDLLHALAEDQQHAVLAHGGVDQPGMREQQLQRVALQVVEINSVVALLNDHLVPAQDVEGTHLARDEGALRGHEVGQDPQV